MEQTKIQRFDQKRLDEVQRMRSAVKKRDLLSPNMRGPLF
jgi:hypothetical protein